MKKYKYLLLDEKACIKMLYEYDVCTSYFIYVKGVTDKFMLLDPKSFNTEVEFEDVYIEYSSIPYGKFYLYTILTVNAIRDDGFILPINLTYKYSYQNVPQNKVKQLFGIS